MRCRSGTERSKYSVRLGLATAMSTTRSCGVSPCRNRQAWSASVLASLESWLGGNARASNGRDDPAYLAWASRGGQLLAHPGPGTLLGRKIGGVLGFLPDRTPIRKRDRLIDPPNPAHRSLPHQ